MTIAQDNAARFATSDREQVADQILNDACRRAAHLFKLGLPIAAKVTLGKAERSAHRILGATR